MLQQIHPNPVFVILSESEPRLNDVLATILASLNFREAVGRIVFKPPYIGRPDPPVGWEFATLALTATKCCNIRSLEILHSTAEPIIVLAEQVELDVCKWPRMQALDFSYWGWNAPRAPDQHLRSLLCAAPNLEELRFPKGCIGDDVAEALPNLRRVVQGRDNDVVVAALTGGRAEHIIDLILDDPSHGPSKIITSRKGLTVHEDALEGRLYEALQTANLSRLRLLEIKSWGNGDNMCSTILHVFETCRTLSTLRIPAWEIQTVTRLIKVLSRAPRGLKVVRLDVSHRQRIVELVPQHVLVSLNHAWNSGGIRGLKRLEVSLCVWDSDTPLSENPSLISFQRFCRERRITPVLRKR